MEKIVILKLIEIAFQKLDAYINKYDLDKNAESFIITRKVFHLLRDELLKEKDQINDRVLRAVKVMVEFQSKILMMMN
jgi:hypothetical protein